MANSSSAARMLRRRRLRRPSGSRVDQAGGPVQHALDRELPDRHLGQLVFDRAKEAIGWPNCFRWAA